MADSNEGPTFRASKRRKVFRKRAGDEASDGEVATATTRDNADQEAQAGTRESSVAVNRRKPGGGRKGGVAFSTAEARRPGGDSGINSALDTEAPDTPLSAVEHAQARFVAPTGHVASADDKHMMAYVDSKLARLPASHEATASSSATTTTPALPTKDSPDSRAGNPHATSQGHLAEVDITPIVASTSTRSRRPRRDWRTRRSSADLARHAFVDQILRESQLNIYSAPPAASTAATQNAGSNEDADERMAEEFKRNFYAAAEERAVRRPAAPPPPTFGANKLESIKGPKLGGSRSQRAAMHAAEKAKAAAGKK